MSISTDGQICYGVLFEDGQIFPWDEDGDIEDWWVYKALNFRHSVEIYTKNGEHEKGIVQEQIDKYFDEKHDFVKNNKLPVELVNYCSGDYPSYILAIPSTYKNCSRGYPQEFEPKDLIVNQEEEKALLDFIANYVEVDKDTEVQPKWYLSSYWG